MVCYSNLEEGRERERQREKSHLGARLLLHPAAALSVAVPAAAAALSHQVRLLFFFNRGLISRV